MTETNGGRLRVIRKVDVPLNEVSGTCLRRDPHGRMSLVAVGDRAATLAWISVVEGGESGPWQTIDLSQVPGSLLAASDPQIEAVCADGRGHVLFLQETPPRAELIDLGTLRLHASVTLAVNAPGELARAWADPEGSRGEGAVLLPNGHLMVAKEKDPAALIEFGPPGEASCGLLRGGGLAAGAPWPLPPGDQSFVALAVWLPAKPLRKACDDFSDLDIGPDGRLYVLSDKSRSIARIGDLLAGGGAAELTAVWKLDLPDDTKPEGLAFDGQGRAIVALDKRKKNNNLVLLEPAIAPLTTDN